MLLMYVFLFSSIPVGKKYCSSDETVLSVIVTKLPQLVNLLTP